nr:zinc finger, CCHC-type [Tanacetum cinerariifolium]
AVGYRRVKVLEFFDCPSPQQGVEDLRIYCTRFKQLGPGVEIGVYGVHDENRVWFEVELHGAQRDRKGECQSMSWFTKSTSSRLMDYQLARDREQHLACKLFEYREDSNKAAFAVVVVEKIYTHESLTFNNTVSCEIISKWKAGLKDDMDAQSDVYVLINSYRKCSDDIDGYYWEYTPGMFIHLFLYIDDMVFSYGCKAVIWATKRLLDKEKGNVLGMEIVRDQSGNTLKVSQSRFYNGKLVQTLLEGHSILSLEGSLSGIVMWKRMTDVHVFVDFDYAMRRSITVMEALSTTEARYMTFTEARKKKIWLKGLLIESGYELRLVAGIATGALVKGCSRSEVPAQVKVATYRY